MAHLVLIDNDNFDEREIINHVYYGNMKKINWQFIRHSSNWMPPTDIFETEENMIVRVEVAGMDPKDFNISLDRRKLSIQGVRQDTIGKRAYQQMEIHFGKFAMEIEISCEVIPNRVRANYKNGFLLVILQKQLPEQIRIENETI